MERMVMENSHLQVVEGAPLTTSSTPQLVSRQQAGALVAELWFATKHTNDQEENRKEIFSVWIRHLTDRPIGLTTRAIGILVRQEDWWPAIAAFERAYKSEKGLPIWVTG